MSSENILLFVKLDFGLDKCLFCLFQTTLIGTVFFTKPLQIMCHKFSLLYPFAQFFSFSQQLIKWLQVFFGYIIAQRYIMFAQYTFAGKLLAFFRNAVGTFCQTDSP